MNDETPTCHRGGRLMSDSDAKRTLTDQVVLELDTKRQVKLQRQLHVMYNQEVQVECQQSRLTRRIEQPLHVKAHSSREAERRETGVLTRGGMAQKALRAKKKDIVQQVMCKMRSPLDMWCECPGGLLLTPPPHITTNITYIVLAPSLTDVTCGLQFGQIATKKVKYGSFLISVFVHFGSLTEN